MAQAAGKQRAKSSERLWPTTNNISPASEARHRKAMNDWAAECRTGGTELSCHTSADESSLTDPTLIPKVSQSHDNQHQTLLPAVMSSSHAAPVPWDSTPSAEWLLQQVDSGASSSAGTIPDSRKLVQDPPRPSNQDDEKAIEEFHKRRSDWQLSLQGHLKSLEAREMITFKSNEEIFYTLTSEGSQIAKQGSQEARLWAALPADPEQGKSLDELKQALGQDVLKIGQGKAFAKKWARKHPSVQGALARTPGVDAINDETAEDLKHIRDTGAAADERRVADLKKRKLVNQK